MISASSATTWILPSQAGSLSRRVATHWERIASQQVSLAVRCFQQVIANLALSVVSDFTFSAMVLRGNQIGFLQIPFILYRMSADISRGPVFLRYIHQLASILPAGFPLSVYPVEPAPFFQMKGTIICQLAKVYWMRLESALILRTGLSTDHRINWLLSAEILLLREQEELPGEDIPY